MYLAGVRLNGDTNVLLPVVTDPVIHKNKCRCPSFSFGEEVGTLFRKGLQTNPV